MNKKINNQSGFLELIIIVIVALLLMKFLGLTITDVKMWLTDFFNWFTTFFKEVLK